MQDAGDRLSLLGAGSIDSGGIFGPTEYSWPLLRMILDLEGGRLRLSESNALPLLTRSIGGVPPDVRFRWEEVEKVELVRTRLALFGRGIIKFHFIRDARRRSKSGFEFGPAGVTNEDLVLDFAEARGVSVLRSV